MNRKVLDLIQLLFLIEDETDHNIVFDFMGHVKGINIRFYRKGWYPGAEASEFHTVYLDSNDIDIKLDMLYEHFSEILKEDDNYEI